MAEMVRRSIPRNKENDYTAEAASARREFVREQTGATLEHVAHYSIDPASLPGNIENFAGVAQVPIGLAGPLRINGNTRRGTFTSPWRRPKERWWQATTAGCGC